MCSHSGIIINMYTLVRYSGLSEEISAVSRHSIYYNSINIISVKDTRYKI